MDQIDKNSNIYVQQYINNDIPFEYSTKENYVDEDTLEIQAANVEHEEISTSFVYKKRIRTKFSQEQLDILEMIFQQHRYPNVDIVDDLVQQLNLSTQKITVWFQNRRARLKKTQQKLDNQNSFDKDDQQQYDSGIHLDEEVSHESSISPPINSLPYLIPPPPLATASSHYYFPNSHLPFYNPMWSNFPYQFQSTMSNAANRMNYNPSEISSPSAFQDISNYQYQREFHDVT